jgi:hypothetical protein
MNGRGTPLHPVRFVRHPIETLLAAATTLGKEPRTQQAVFLILRAGPTGQIAGTESRVPYSAKVSRPTDLLY